MKKIVMCGGGTAGHIMPNIALFPTLSKNYTIYYIGDNNGMERDLIAKYPNVKFYGINSVKFIRKFTLKNLAIPFKLYKAIKDCKRILNEIKPDIIFSKGGYVSVPVVLAASMLHIPIVGHESDYTIGLANKIIYRKCAVMCFSFKATAIKHSKKGVFTGSPIRPSLIAAHPENINKLAKFDTKKPNITIIGGSLGAHGINASIWDNINALTKRYNIVHLVGKGNRQDVHISNYVQIEFLHSIQDAFAWADVVISRAGSNVIFELLYLRKPMILIPLPKDVSRGDQILNAYEFEKNGYARVLLQSELNIDTLNSNIEYVLSHKNNYYSNMQKTAKNTGNILILEQIEKYTRKDE